MSTPDSKLRRAIDWYNRESRRAKRIGIDVELAKEAADRFGAPRIEVLDELGYRATCASIAQSRAANLPR